MSSGLVQRKKNKEEAPAAEDQEESFKAEKYDNNEDLTLMEEIVLLGLKDNEVPLCLPRGCCLSGMITYHTFYAE